MKIDDKYILKISSNVTYLINKNDSSEIYEFTNSAKTIIDNHDKSKNEIIDILIKNYGIDKIKALKAYEALESQLNELNDRVVSKEIKLSDLQSNINGKLNHCTIEITNICPFHCRHCYVPKQEKIFMELGMFKNIIDQLKVSNCNWILITGGEPLIHPNFIEMYKYAKENGFFVSLNTTTYPLNDDIIDVFNKYKPDVIEVSVYGYDKESYSSFVDVSDAFEKVNSNIRKLIDNKQNVKLKSVATKSNLNTFSNIKKYAKYLNLSFRWDYIIFPKLNELYKPNDELLSPEEIISLIKLDDDEINHFKKQVIEINKYKNKDNNIDKLYQCGLGKDRIFIDCSGNIKLCLVVPNSLNINDYNLDNALSLLNDEVDSLTISNNSKCKKCYKRKLCRYCPGRFYIESGTFDNPPKFYCDMADEIIKEFK